MDIAVILSDRYYAEPIIDRFDFFRHKTELFESLSEARILFTKRFDGIYLWPSFVSRGYSADVRTDGSPEFFGKKILTEIIRAEGSANKDTPTVVSVGMDTEQGYTCEDYKRAGANLAILSATDMDKAFEYFEQQFRKVV